MLIARRRLLASAGVALPLSHLPLVPQAALANTAAANLAPDWDVPDGHFYTQTAPRDAAPDSGFVVSNTGGTSFWRDFKAMGGPAQLGFPISARWESEGERFQATESVLLHWAPGAREAEIFPVFRLFADYGMDNWLEAQGIPPTAPELIANPQLPVFQRHAWLTNPTLRAAYWSHFDVQGPRRFGLPMGEPMRLGPYITQRFERAVLQLWVDHVAGQPEPGSLVMVQAGDLLRRAAMIPDGALTPQAAPAPRPEPVPALANLVVEPNPTGKHIILSISKQWLFAYEEGELLMNGPVTTGRPELLTPLGSFRILSKHAPYTFVSPWGPGSPFWYETATSSYALRITDNGVFLHDAPWRPFNGPGTNVPHVDPDGVWRTGSHGCINMRLADAAWTHRWAPLGMPVDIIA
ncbi:MAG TPA: L,D-transpeptidase [Chloroflexota bacterium]|nr:L,D-transpeptidase [Chloroflexota bacterium]